MSLFFGRRVGAALALTGLLSACSAPTVGRDGATKNPRSDDATGDQQSRVSEDAVPEIETGKWTWLDVPESTCANGESTGIGMAIHRSGRMFGRR